MKTFNFLIFALALGIAAVGCGVDPQKGCSGYECATKAEATVFLREETFLDCNGKINRVEVKEYEGSYSTVRIHSLNNINIGKGEFTNKTNGATVTTRQGEEFIKFGKKDLQDMPVSGFNRDRTLKLEKGINEIHYKYSNCSRTDANGECGVWGVAEEGDRLVYALYSKVLDSKCDRKPVCVNGQIQSHDFCEKIVKIEPKVLDMDYGKDIVK